MTIFGKPINHYQDCVIMLRSRKTFYKIHTYGGPCLSRN
uniref:Uncharacterized protein n=1 Tax=Arundo donax TaxID=35708 RepID=A0A0A9AW75_ARUDO